MQSARCFSVATPRRHETTVAELQVRPRLLRPRGPPDLDIRRFWAGPSCDPRRRLFVLAAGGEQSGGFVVTGEDHQIAGFVKWSAAQES